jgi:hypothetical protein
VDLAGEGVEEHTVDGEVAAEGVFTGRREDDLVGAAAVGVGAVGAEGGDLDAEVAGVGAGAEDLDDAEADADGDGAAEEALDFVGAGGGGDVEVLGDEAEEFVADAAAGEEGFVAGVGRRRRRRRVPSGRGASVGPESGAFGAMKRWLCRLRSRPSE